MGYSTVEGIMEVNLPLFEGDDFVEIRGRVVTVNEIALYLAVNDRGFNPTRIEHEFINPVPSDPLEVGKLVVIYVVEGYARKLGFKVFQDTAGLEPKKSRRK